jgi:hypothetical protein
LFAVLDYPLTLGTNQITDISRQTLAGFFALWFWQIQYGGRPKINVYAQRRVLKVAKLRYPEHAV